jgi:hypothetical protein
LLVVLLKKIIRRNSRKKKANKGVNISLSTDKNILQNTPKIRGISKRKSGNGFQKFILFYIFDKKFIMKTLKFLSALFICCLVCNAIQAQAVIKSNKNKKVVVKKNNNKKVIVKSNRHNSHGSRNVNTHGNHPHHSGNGKVIIKSNRNNIIVKRPNRPNYVKKPFLNRRGYLWISGYWGWSGNTYIWIDGFWERERHGFHWHDGYWEETPHGFYWVEGYWCDIY